MKKIKKLFALLILTPVLLFTMTTYAEENPLEEKYTLEQVIVLSRHNLRAPLSSNGSVPQELTPYSWIQWTANSSELTVKGGIQETNMGQYFRKWLDQEGLIAENTIPEDGEVRFYARDKQRCRATARYFAAGMLPLTDISVEYPGESDPIEDFMSPDLKFYTEDYAADAKAQVAAMGGDNGFEGVAEQTGDAIRLLMDVVDMKDSEAYRSGKYGDLLSDGSDYIMEAGKEPDLTGAVKTASQVADALLLQYYEEQDAVKAAFGYEMTEADWTSIGGFLTEYLELKHGAPLVALSVTHPLIRELKSELMNEQRKFCFLCGHDCTVLGTLVALGVESYELPDCIETKAPIGVKILFERWRDENGQAWYRVDLVYRSTEQIRNSTVLTLDNPPMRYDLRFEGVETNEDGMISGTDLFGMFDRTLAEFDELKEVYPDLSSWTENAQARIDLTDYIADITDKGSESYIPVEDRIAVFDLDGTLMCETYPRCFEYMVFADYVLNNPDYTPSDEIRAVAQEIIDTKWQEKPSGISTRQAAAAAVAYAGMTPAELEEYVKGFMDSDAEGFTGLKRGDAYYQPMVEVVNLLKANDFQIYIVTATERNIVRALVGDTLGIRPANVIGTEYGYTATGQEDTEDGDYTFRQTDKVVFDGNYYGENVKMSKVDAIVREIGQQPVLAFGNSSGDTAMCTYVITDNPYPAHSYMVIADDEEREWGDAEGAQEKIDNYTELGIGIISMRDDFATIYGDGVEKDVNP